MLGRKKRNSYFFYPPGGNQPETYMNRYIQESFLARQQASHLYSMPYPQQQGTQYWYNNQMPYIPPFTNPYPNNMNNTNAYAGHPNMMNQGFAQSVFQNPLQPVDEQYNPYYQQQMVGQTSMNQYPNPTLMAKQPGGIGSIMNSFKSQDGSMDINKMVNTAGQMVSAISQVKSMVQGLGGMLKV
jgi:hypothetical protein